MFTLEIRTLFRKQKFEAESLSEAALKLAQKTDINGLFFRISAYDGDKALFKSKVFCKERMPEELNGTVLAAQCYQLLSELQDELEALERNLMTKLLLDHLILSAVLYDIFD
jgi:hypothetical protein